MNRNVAEIFTTETGIIFFSGIGGIGMSAIAIILHKLGYNIQGSDVKENANIIRLRELGVKVYIGQKAENIKAAQIIVRTSAIGDDHPEILAAKERGLPILGRGEMLAQIMQHKKSVTIAGSHGKTTTTSMMDALFAHNLSGTTVINGGVLNSCNSNAYFGDGEWLVAEADESDGSFLLLPAQIAVVTNIDPEHLDHYGSFANLKKSFRDFICKVPEDGFAVYCHDREELREITADLKQVRCISYGLSCGANLRAINIRQTASGSKFSVEVNIAENHYLLEDVSLPIFGTHNIQNALAVMAVGIGLSFPSEKIIAAISAYQGVKRRLTVTGVVNEITIIDDYAHHPVEIKASLQAISEMIKAQSGNGRVVAVMQPHRYTRLAGLFSEFAASLKDADLAFICDVFAAGESPIAGINKENLAQEAKKLGKEEVYLVDDLENLAGLLKPHIKKGDVVICLGAGSISKYANQLPAQLKNLL